MKTSMRLFALLLIVALSLPLIPANAADEEQILSDDLIELLNSEEYQNDPDKTAPVVIWLFDSVDNDAALSQAEAETGLAMEELLSGKPLISEEDYRKIKDIEDDEEFGVLFSSLIDQEAKEKAEEKSLLMNDLILAKRNISQKMYLEQNQKYVSEMGLSADECVYISRFSPLVEADLTAEEIWRISENEDVCEIWFDDRSFEEETSPTIAGAAKDAYGNYVRQTIGWTGNGVKVGIVEQSYVSPASTIANYIYSEDPYITHGPIGSSHTNTVGAIIAGTDGFAPNATVYSCATSSTYTTYLAIESVLSSGVAIINLSANTSSSANGSYNISDQWADHITSQHNVTFVKSAGNHVPDDDDHNPLGYITSPGMAYNAITVGGHLGYRYSEDPRIRSIASCYRQSNGCAEKPDILAYGGTISFAGQNSGGTSWAAAAVTGAISQLMQGSAALKARPTLAKALVCAGARYWLNNGSLASTTAPLRGIHAFSERQGAGVLHVKAAATILSAGRYYYTSGGTTVSSITKTFNVTSNDAIIRVCMTWEKRNTCTGNHGLNNAQTTGLANWDLKVVSPSGVIWKSESEYNNLELICFVPNETGVYTITATKLSTYADREYVSIAWY